MWQRNDYKRKNRVWLLRMEKRVYLQEAFLIITFSLYEAKQNLYIIEYKQVCTRRSIAPVYEKQYAQSSPNKSMAPFSIQKKVLRVNNRFGYAIPADRGY